MTDSVAREATKRLEAGKPGSLEAWKLGSLEAGKLGSWEAWKLVHQSDALARRSKDFGE
jgi:hypothetical protein